LNVLRDKLDRQIFLVGNGGSSAIASHMANDLGKYVSEHVNRKVRAMSLTDHGAMLTAVANDCGYNEVFVYQLENWAMPGDLLIAFSGSGNSNNIIESAQWCRHRGIHTIGVSGGGKLLTVVDTPVHVPLNDMQQLEDSFSIISHLLCKEIGCWDD